MDILPIPDFAKAFRLTLGELFWLVIGLKSDLAEPRLWRDRISNVDRLKAIALSDSIWIANLS